jgi:hypothetical protein
MKDDTKEENVRFEMHAHLTTRACACTTRNKMMTLLRLLPQTSDQMLRAMMSACLLKGAVNNRNLEMEVTLSPTKAHITPTNCHPWLHDYSSKWLAKY